MPRERAQIVAVVDTVKGLVLEMQSHTGGRINQLNKALDSDLYILKHITELRVARVEAALIKHVTLIYQDATYHTLRAYFYASPSLWNILITIWTAIQYIYEVVKFALAMVQVMQMLKLDDVLAHYWPAFEEARRKFRMWVTRLSDAIGWGISGVLHLIQATQGFTDVIGGLTKKSYTWMEAQWMVKTGNILKKLNTMSTQLTERPGEILEILFQSELRDSFKLSLKFGEEMSIKFRDLTTGTTRLFQGLGDVADDLIAIQEGMPEVIRANIPQAIWDGLNTFSETINEQILPRIATAERHLDLFDSIFANQSGKLSDIATRLAHPGTNLLGIDQLGDYARQGEEWAIDDVSARLWNDQVNADRDYMQADLNAFAIIDAAMTSPLPVLPFMDIESPQRGALHGIVVEPQETWFVGGYKSPY